MEDQPTITDGKITITKDDLVPYIQEQGKMLNKSLWKAIEKYGCRYNDKNKFEVMKHKMGDPENALDAKRYAEEFILILQKKSTLPAAIRYPVRDICNSALKSCYQKKIEVELRKAKMQGHLGTELGNKVNDVLVDAKNKEKNDL